MASKDASKDFKSVMNPNSGVFDDDISYNENLPVSSKIPITVNKGSGSYVPPRPSQFNNNITLGQGQTENKQTEGVTYFNNRAIDY